MGEVEVMRLEGKTPSLRLWGAEGKAGPGEVFAIDFRQLCVFFFNVNPTATD